MSGLHLRPPTPQALMHKMPDNPVERSDRRPTKFIVLITGSTTVAGKLQIAQSVAKGLSCILLQGEAFHESSAKAAKVGAARAGADAGPNEARYQRMWLSKVTRTGSLFPDESRPAQEGFSGFGGSASTSRRGSASSVESSEYSLSSSRHGSFSSAAEHAAPSATKFLQSQSQNKVFTESEVNRLRRENPALMVMTHPNLEAWHRLALRNAVGDYGIGILFADLEAQYDDGDGDGDDELPVLKPLDPRTMTSFPVSFGQLSLKKEATLDEEMKITVASDKDIDGKTEDVIAGAKEYMS